MPRKKGSKNKKSAQKSKKIVKPKIKKKVTKKPIKKKTKKIVKKVPLKRGAKKGVKRGPYKKREEGAKLIIMGVDLTNFNLDPVDDSMKESAWDIKLSVLMPGIAPRAHYKISFTPFFKKNEIKFSQVAFLVGEKIDRKGDEPLRVVAVFDSPDLTAVNTNILVGANGSYSLESRNITKKILNSLKIKMPTKSDEILEAFFKLTPIAVSSGKNKFKVCELNLLKSDLTIRADRGKK